MGRVVRRGRAGRDGWEGRAERAGQGACLQGAAAVASQDLEVLRG